MLGCQSICQAVVREAAAAAALELAAELLRMCCASFCCLSHRGVTRVLAVTDRCPYNMRLRTEW